MQNWKKVLIGIILLGGFALFTHFQKSAEPAWKVDEEKFNVVKTFHDGMKQEYNNLDELKTVDKYGFLKDENKEVPIESDYRTLKIEKVWNMESRVYVLYSVDLKERDKGVEDVPRLQVKNMRVATDDGKELVASAAMINSPTNYSEGFVFKHRLYRSLYMYPALNENFTEEDYQILSDATRIELQDTELVTNNGTKAFKNIGFKVSNETLFDKVLESKSINKKITYGSNQKITIKEFEKTFYENRITLKDVQDHALVGFAGENGQQGMFWDIIYSKELGYFIPIPSQEESPVTVGEEKKSTTITFVKSLHKGNEKFSWKIPKSDIISVNKSQKRSVSKNEVIGTDRGKTIRYLGLSWYNGAPSIDISVTNNSPIMTKDQHMDSFILNLNAGWRFEGNEDFNNGRWKRNVLTIKDDENSSLKYYTLENQFEDNIMTYHVQFFPEPVDDGEINYVNIPEKDLNINISDLVYTEPLSSPVQINYKK